MSSRNVWAAKALTSVRWKKYCKLGKKRKTGSKQNTAESLKCKKLIRGANDDRRLWGWNDWVQ